MLSRRPYFSSYEAYLNYLLGRILKVLLGLFAPRINLERSYPHQHAVSIQIVSQIPQSHLGFHPDLADDPNDQPPRSLRLNPKDMFDSTSNSGTRPITLDLDPSGFYACIPWAEDAPDTSVASTSSASPPNGTPNPPTRLDCCYPRPKSPQKPVYRGPTRACPDSRESIYVSHSHECDFCYLDESEGVLRHMNYSPSPTT